MRRRSGRGSGIIESICMAVILIIVAVLLIDLIVLVMANSMNDSAAKNACRAAANQSDWGKAQDAANKALESFQSSTIVNDIKIQSMSQPTSSTVMVQTQMVVHLPMPIPGWEYMTFQAKDVEPIVDFAPN